MVAAGDVVDIADVVGTWNVISLVGSSGGGAIAGTESQGQQTEVGFVAQVDKAQVGVGVGCLCRSLFI